MTKYRRYLDIKCEDCGADNFIVSNTDDEFECGNCGCVNEIEDDMDTENE